MIQNGTCDVCGRERRIGVASLPFAAMSVAFCHECLREGAYPLWALHACAEICGGYAQTNEWFQSLRSWKDGRYIDGPEVMACYAPTGL
jgi:hypothetical protein